MNEFLRTEKVIGTTVLNVKILQENVINIHKNKSNNLYSSFSLANDFITIIQHVSLLR